MKLKDKNWLNECLDVEWKDEWIKGWMFRLRCIGWVPGCWRREEWMNEWMNECLDVDVLDECLGAEEKRINQSFLLLRNSLNSTSDLVSF